MTQLGPLPPPVDLVKAKDTIVIVSSRKPVTVFFSRAMSLVDEQMISYTKTKKNKILRIELVACGGAIGRCRQIARYTTQALNDKYRHIVSKVEKSTTIKKAAVVVENPLFTTAADGGEEEENAFDVEHIKRELDQIRIVITGEFC